MLRHDLPGLRWASLFDRSNQSAMLLTGVTANVRRVGNGRHEVCQLSMRLGKQLAAVGGVQPEIAVRAANDVALILGLILPVRAMRR